MRFLLLLLLVLLPALALAAPTVSAPPSPDLVVVVEGPDGGPVEAPGSLVAPAPASAEASAAAPASVPSAAPPSGPASLSVEIPGVVVPSDTLFPGDADVFGQGKATFEAVQAARRAPTVTGIAAAIVAGIMLLISVARRFGGLLLTSNQVRLFVVLASALAGGLANLSDGMVWTEILFVALAPVVSVGVHQVFVKPVTKKKG